MDALEALAALLAKQDPDAEIERALRITKSKSNHFEWNAETNRHEMLSARACPKCNTIGIRLVMTMPWDEGRGRGYGWQCKCGDWNLPGEQFERILERRDIH